jgi:lycopene cyclase domain-containing protein
MYRYLVVIGIGFLLCGLAYLVYGLRLPKPKLLLKLLGILLVCMLLFDTYLTALPIVLYNSNSILGVRLGSIPVEDFGYLVIVVLLGPALYEYFYNEKKD